MDVRFRTVKMKKATGLLFFLWLLIMGDFPDASRLGMATQTDLEVKEILSRLNKAPLKSIKSPDGDIIDCVHVSHQPAFDHPLLKNHTIQMSPSYHPEGRVFDDSKVSSAKTRGKGDKKPIIQLWHLNGRCPEGTVPIRRIKEEDVLRASSVESFGKKNHPNIPKPKSADVQNSRPGHEYATAFVVGYKYYGTRATINVWAPIVQQPNELTSSQLWITGGLGTSDENSIEAGWQVNPNLYGDNNTRFFTYWTSDNYQSTGCYNLLCSGFIQINNQIALGATISPLSVYDGSQYDITIVIWKDPKVGNWWLQYQKEYVLGYWPGNIFSWLIDSASAIAWGGEVVNTKSDGMHTTTQMGNGHFPEEGYGKASFFRNIRTVDGSNQFRNVDGLGTNVVKSSCYSIANFGKSEDWWNYFYYGGPGRNPNCP